MKDQSKTKQMLIQELVSLRHRISELERSESELKRAKEVLKDSESKFQFLAENMADVVFAVDLNLMTTYVSPSIERLLGFTPQERMTQKADQQLTLKSQKLVFEALSEELSQEKEKGSDPDRSKTLELEYYHKDGSIKHLLTYIRGIRDSEGNLTGFYGSSHDITERKRAEEAFSKEYSFRNAIINNVSEGLCVCYETTEYPFVKFTIWNDRMTEITGYTMEQINRLGWYQTVYPDPELQAKAIERMKSMRQREDLRSEEWEITRADGNKRVLNILTSIVESDDGVVHVLALMQDITDRKCAEEVLRESEERFHLVSKASNDAIYDWNLESGTAWLSEAHQILFGVSTDNADFTWWSSHIHPEDRDRVISSMHVAMEKRVDVWWDEYRFRCADGHYVDIFDRGHIRRDKKGTPIRLVGSMMDITERKSAQESLRLSEARYRLLAENARDVIWTVGMDMRLSYVSPSVKMLLGFTEEESMARTMQQAFTPASYEKTMRLFTEEMEIESAGCGDPNRSRILELDLVCKDGNTLTVEGNFCFLRDTTGKAIGILSILRDITERKRAEEALSRSEQLLKETQTISKVGGWEYDIEKKLITWTDEVYRIYGVEKNYDPNDIEKSISFYHEDDKQIIKKAFLNAVNTGKHYDLELQFNAADGTPKWVRTMGDSVLKDGKIIKVYGNIIDITERKRMEEELLKADKLESVGLLAGGIAHDFNNILTSISGNISMAKMQINPDHKIFDLLSAAEKASVRAQELTRQLLTFARGGAPVKETASISKLIKESSLVILRGSKSVCEFQIPEDLWSVEADVGQISQAISNIVINANHAMPGGGIIRIMAENLMPDNMPEIPAKPGRYIRISIKDQGVGIAEQNLSKIFDPYFTTKQARSGLGLATAYSIIQKHSGHISVDSRLGAGTTFHIYLPASEKKVSVKDEAVLLKGCGRILVMDDDKTLKEMMYDMLDLLGYESEFSRDGDEAIEMYREAMESEKPFDAVILDLTIPGGMGGEEAIKILMEIDPEVKAIVFSGYSASEVMSNFREYGFKGMMPKPFDTNALGKVLNDVLKDCKSIKET